MYVEDMSLDEARQWEAELERVVSASAPGTLVHTQAQFDLEDVRARIRELEG